MRIISGILRVQLIEGKPYDTAGDKLEMERLDGIMIATTNLTTNLDKAFERRFIYKIEFGRPSVEARCSIWKSMIPRLNAKVALQLATDFEFTGGQIENVARKSAVDMVLSGNRDCLKGCASIECPVLDFFNTSGDDNLPKPSHISIFLAMSSEDVTIATDSFIFIIIVKDAVLAEDAESQILVADCHISLRFRVETFKFVEKRSDVTVVSVKLFVVKVNAQIAIVIGHSVQNITQSAIRQAACHIVIRMILLESLQFLFQLSDSYKTDVF